MAEGPSMHRSLKLRISLWIRELRAPFFTATLVPVMLGAAIAWALRDVFNPPYFILSLAGALCLHAGTNIANDYFDFKSGCDVVNREFIPPFTGGSRLLPTGELRPYEVHAAALLFFGVASVIGVYLAMEIGWVIILLGVIGILAGYFYTMQLATRGVGEFFVGLNFGPLAVLGSYYVQTRELAWEPLAASIPVGLLIANVLWINQIPDYTADKHVGKNTLVVRLGRKRSADVYALILAATYASIVLGVASGLMAITSLMALVTLPQSLKAIGVARKYYDDPPKLAPANASMVMIHLFTGLLLAVGYVVPRLFVFP